MRYLRSGSRFAARAPQLAHPPRSGGERDGRGAARVRASAWGVWRTWTSPSGVRAWTRVALGFLCLAAVAGCRQDMHNQPKYKPLRGSTFFADGSSARPLVEGTVARGALEADNAFYTGKNGETAVAELPIALTAELVDRGEERYNVFCSPCHDRTGSGRGMVVQRGYRQPPSLHDERLRTAPAGHFFDVITNGFGAMPNYRTEVPPLDRWAIVAYIRALQLSQAATAADVPGGNPDEANKARAAQPGPAKH